MAERVRRRDGTRRVDGDGEGDPVDVLEAARPRRRVMLLLPLLLLLLPRSPDDPALALAPAPVLTPATTMATATATATAVATATATDPAPASTPTRVTRPRDGLSPRPFMDLEEGRGGLSPRPPLSVLLPLLPRVMWRKNTAPQTPAHGMQRQARSKLPQMENVPPCMGDDR